MKSLFEIQPQSHFIRLPTTGVGEKRYRVEGKAYNNDKVYIYLIECDVIRRTPAGAWVKYYEEEKFVLNGNGKRFAHETEAWALASFIRRKEFEKAYAKARLESAETQREFALRVYMEMFS